MSSVQFGTYNPTNTEEEDTPPKLNITIGAFFDGTLNNKTNTESRLGQHGEKGREAHKNHGSDGSYTNDLSNVARMQEFYQGEVNKEKDEKLNIYIEGIGTENFKGDSLYFKSKGASMGRGPTGIRAKVRKGCEEVFKVIKDTTDKTDIEEINKLTIDVYGFSRGAAAARNFVHEITKAAYTAKKGPYFYVDSFNKQIPEGDKELPKRGHLGYLLQKNNITINLLKVRFVGLYDTVSSYDPTAEFSPDFSNDIEELKLNSIRQARHIIQLAASDEHRKNFALTSIPIGQQYHLPGVHSDIGGCYTHNTSEGEIQIMDQDNTWRDGRSDEDWDTIVNNDLDHLIAEGWFPKEHTKRANSWHETYGSRGNISNRYSYIPLHIMCEQTNKKTKDEAVFKIAELNEQYVIPSDKELDLKMVKLRIDAYIKGEKPSLKFYTSSLINKITHQAKQGILSKEEYAAKVSPLTEDRDMLLRLRKRYLHFSSMYGSVSGSNIPNYTIHENTIIRKRQVY
ncbi:conserved hypothetical protein [Tenacibaculum maritimum]|uniref:phospholipase effector Tle1 domain-containing protein n=1 Tax=Tenacibaculum maritimum TaxID=107401 RepID=UPI0012E4B767|nr:DUF2235 domain-containing protein [Tenacibaculum maritimum]CAA0241649.1 conserved hypothetical protein [Tenacibaculum maritimum]